MTKFFLLFSINEYGRSRSRLLAYSKKKLHKQPCKVSHFLTYTQ